MRRALILAIRAYQLTVASILGGQCRFEPSCSHYAQEAIDRHGAIRGIRLATGRILRCHPFARAGYDPVPLGGNAQHMCAYPQARQAVEESGGGRTKVGDIDDGH